MCYTRGSAVFFRMISSTLHHTVQLCDRNQDLTPQKNHIYSNLIKRGLFIYSFNFKMYFITLPQNHIYNPMGLYSDV